VTQSDKLSSLFRLELIVIMKCSIVHDQGLNVIKHLCPLLTYVRNKLEFVPSRRFQPSLMFADMAGSLP
jgi:hypothetical protein